MKREDFEGEPCFCAECSQAGIAGERPRRDPYSGKILHGYSLKGVLMAEKNFWETARKAGTA